MPPPTPSTPPSTPRAPNNCCARVTVRGGGSVPASRPRRPRAGAAGRGWRAPPPADAGAAGRGGADGGAGRRAGARVGGAARAGGGPAEAGAAAEEGAERRGDGALRTGAGGGQRHRPRCVQMLKSMCAGQRLANEPQDPAAVSLPTSSEPETRGRNKGSTALRGALALAEHSSREGSSQRMLRQPIATRLPKAGRPGKSPMRSNT
ncbi:mitotic-spindle organizing protein 2B isoform X2 [Saimiri boliviensis]|uniref:mitotic-spindle organizing protein 2B isoform X2 n=1 Tax=Saimiri boliviensis TaxID=27679 RepID=UPI003D77513E